MKKRFAFDMQSAIQTAWDMLWAANLERRKENDDYTKKTGKKSFDEAGTYYICSADIERTVRGFAQQSFEGHPWTLGGYAYNVRMQGNLQRTVRDWLLHGNRGKIVGHNFGKGHISGMRFRPVGEPMAEAELQTIKRNEDRRLKPRPRHYGKSKPICTANRRRSMFSRPSRNIWTTNNKSDVTCPRCLNLLAKMPAEVKAQAIPEVAKNM